jgi:hypothetical protein
VSLRAAVAAGAGPLVDLYWVLGYDVEPSCDGVAAAAGGAGGEESP